MARKVLRPLRPIYDRYREPLLYLLFGGLTFLLSVLTFWLFAHPLGIGPLLANGLSWVLCVAFAYVTNRTWVFENRARTPAGIFREALSFAGGRLATLALEELLLWLGITVLGLPDLGVKVAAQVLVILGNYIISKLLVFRREEDHGA